MRSICVKRPAIIAAIAFTTFSLSASAQDEEPVLTVESSLVVLNAKITDKAGRHVAGLRSNQFSIYEDGVKQQIDFFQAEETPFAAVILLDTSGSMGQNVSLARAAAIRFLDGLRANDSAAIYRFDSKVSRVQDFSNSRDVTEKIFDLKSYGMTVLNDAVFEAAVLLEDRPEKRRAIIVLSDGADTQSRRSADKALKAALAANAVIYTVDMSDSTQATAALQGNRAVLKRFAERTGGTFVASPGGVAMREAFASIVDELGVQYTLGYQPVNEKKDGKWRAIELRVARPNLTIRTRQGYHAEKVNN